MNGDEFKLQSRNLKQNQIIQLMYTFDLLMQEYTYTLRRLTLTSEFNKSSWPDFYCLINIFVLSQYFNYN